MPEPQNPVRAFRLDAYGPRLDALAKRQGVKAAVIVRRALGAYLDGAGAPAGSSDELAAIASQLVLLRVDLARIGGNLNQIAYAFNTDRPMPVREIAETQAQLQAQFAALAAYLVEVKNAVRA